VVKIVLVFRNRILNTSYSYNHTYFFIWPHKEDYRYIFKG